MTTNGLTPALERCLFAHRRLCEEKGRAPTRLELAAALSIRGESAVRSLEKLGLRGYRLPLSKEWSRNPAVVGMVAETQDAREGEIRRLGGLLRLADKLVSRYGDAEDVEWSRFRREAAPYLEAK